MSKKCPYCGSCNTELSVSNYATRAAINAGRVAIAIGATLITSAFNPSAGHAAGHTVLHNTDPGEFKGHLVVIVEKTSLPNFIKCNDYE